MTSPPDPREKSGQESLPGFCRGEMHPRARKGIQEYNAGEYYEAHEYLELAWRDTDSPGRDLYQGILQVGVAYYQIQRGNYRGALKMFNRARDLLQSLPDVCQGVDVAVLRRDAKRVEDILREKGPEEMDEIDPGRFQPVPMTGSQPQRREK